MYFASNNGSQNTFIYQPIFDTLELKKDKGIDYILRWKSKGVYNLKLKLLYTAFLHSIKLSEYKMEIKFDKDPFAVKQNNYLTKTVNVYIVYDLDAWSGNPADNFKFNNCLFWTTNIVKNSDEGNYLHSGYGATDSKSFDNDFARNVIIFGVYITSSSHSDNHKNNF